MSTIRSQVVVAALAALMNEDEGSGIPDGLAVDLRRGSPSEAAQLPLTMVGRRSEQVTSPPGKLRFPVNTRTLILECDHWAAGENAEEALESQLAWATKAIGTDPTLSGLVLDVEELSTEWDVEVTDTRFARAKQQFAVRYTTKRIDQEKKQ